VNARTGAPDVSGAQQEIATVVVDPARARIYTEGWQSWSVTDIWPVTARPSRVTSPESLAIDCQYGRDAPDGVFQGSGLLAIDPGTGAPVEVFGNPDSKPQIQLIQAALRGNQMVVSADGPVTSLVDAGPGGIEGALSRWADAFTMRSRLQPGSLRQIPPVWCSWYQYYSEVTAADVLANLDVMKEFDLPVGVVQIDDGYEAAPGDWLIPSGHFSGLPSVVKQIRDTGRHAGIWLAPLLVGRSSRPFAEHPDWVVRDRDGGEPVFAGHVCRDACTALDITHPAAADYLAEVLTTMKDWGVDYFKLDFLYAGAFEGNRHSATGGVDAYRYALRLIRRTIGPDAFLAGCGAPILPAVGLVDTMRIGPDVAANYLPADGNPSTPSQRNASRNVRARAWQHGRFWVNDPDCLMARPQVEQREQWADTIERFSGVRASGDGLRDLDVWGLQTTRRLLIPSPLSPLT
jgi:alpha-galactosidase